MNFEKLLIFIFQINLVEIPRNALALSGSGLRIMVVLREGTLTVSSSGTLACL